MGRGQEIAHDYMNVVVEGAKNWSYRDGRYIAVSETVWYTWRMIYKIQITLAMLDIKA